MNAGVDAGAVAGVEAVADLGFVWAETRAAAGAGDGPKFTVGAGTMAAAGAEADSERVLLPGCAPETSSSGTFEALDSVPAPPNANEDEPRPNPSSTDETGTGAGAGAVEGAGAGEGASVGADADVGGGAGAGAGWTRERRRAEASSASTGAGAGA